MVDFAEKGGKTAENSGMDTYHMDCHNSRMESILRRDLLQGTCRSCTLPHLYSPGVCPAFAGLDPAPHVPRQIRPAEDWSVLVSGDGDPDVSRYNELERKRAAREHGPVKSVPQLRLSRPLPRSGQSANAARAVIFLFPPLNSNSNGVT